MRFLIVISVFLCFSFVSLAVDYPMVRYTVDDGLPSNVVYDVYQDRSGFLWFTTDKGVARFNGLKFETFTTYDGLPDNEVFCVAEDVYGRIWMGTYAGYICYYKNGKFHTAANTPFLKLPAKESMINQIRMEADSSITVYFLDKLFFLNIVGEYTHTYSLDRINKQFPKMEIQAIKKVNDGTYKIIYPRRTIVVDTNMDVLSKEEHPELRYMIKSQRGYFYNNDSIYTDNHVPVGANNNRFIIDKHITSIYADKQNYFVSTTRGVLMNNSTILLDNISVARVNSDNEGNYWFCTIGNGVYVLNKNFKATFFYKDAYRGVAKYAKASDEGLYIATQDKSLYRLYENKVECLFNAHKRVSINTMLYRNCYFVEDNVYCAFGNSENFLVRNINSPSPDVQSFTSQRDYANEMFSSRGYVYFTAVNHIYYVLHTDIFSGKRMVYERDLKIPQREIIYAKTISTDNYLWYSTRDKLYKVVEDSAIIQPQLNGVSFKSFGIYGNYMVGYTHENVLLVCNNFEGKVSLDTVKNENCVWGGFYQLDSNHVLITTNNLYRILTLYPSGGKPVFTVRALENPFIPVRAEYTCSNSKTVFFLKNGNITALPIKDVLAVPNAPSPVFLSFKTKKQEYNIQQAIRLSYNEARYISLTLAAPAFNRNVFYQYAVTLDGDTDVWRSIKGQEIDIYNLKYGTYAIKVRVKTQASSYSNPVVLTLVVLKPFWFRWWFIAGCCLVLAILVFLMVRYSIRRAVKKKENEIRFLRSEYKVLNALMNPHFIFNALNSVQGLINSNDKSSASEYLRIFSDLVRQNMQNVSQELISLQKEIHLVTNYLKLEKLRFKQYLNYTINIDDAVDLDIIMIPPLLIQPLVENAVKHGLLPKQSPGNEIIISIYEEGEMLHITIADNGVGLHHPQSRQYHSYGLDNIRRRLAQLATIHDIDISFTINEITAESGSIEGTKAELVIHVPVEV